MRSNDAVWGLPYDVFLFTFIQELLSVRLGVQLGTYFHFATSLHIYERHFELAREVLKSPRPLDFSMSPIRNIEALDDFLASERSLRSQNIGSTPALGSYWLDLLSVLRLFRQSREIGWSRHTGIRSRFRIHAGAQASGNEASMVHRGLNLHLQEQRGFFPLTSLHPFSQTTATPPPSRRKSESLVTSAALY